MHCSKTLLYFLSIIWFLIPETKALNFNLTNIGPENQNVDITVFLAASISYQGLQVTSDVKNSQQSAGKATYIHPLHPWDNSTGNLTDFYTHFVFVVDTDGQTDFADGITFFLAPNGSNSWGGGAIGLPADGGNLTSPFVAVEFDTFQNSGVDPVGINPVTHVGIDVNSSISNVTAIWYCNVTNGTENEAWIRYDSSSFNLSVVFTSSTNTTRVQDTINLIIDLRDYLPEWVTFGFSGATGKYFEKNTVKSWEFSSSLGIDETNRNVTDPVKPGSNKISHGAVVGLVVGSGVLVGGFVLVGFGLWKRSRAKEEDEFEVEMSMENEFKSGAKMPYGDGGMGRLLEAADPKLGPDFDEREMERLMIVGLWCAHLDHNFRPKIRQAIHVLNFEAPPPILPQKQPALSFFPPPLNTTTTSLDTSKNQYSSSTCNTDSSKLTSSSTVSSPSMSLLHTICLDSVVRHGIDLLFDRALQGT
ncbi:hypothetical protein RHSIM_RhsimUnG0176000 [Rhododendron simsii]|uniref:Legume lectin domain-containing protein n=1 Tax=Rhododendron simsii TaxID=118357 RepID=A0A834L4A2_RHOSS|nr:hypothetical protein RHSIM_RhsimUnG0176000 [Rhododendron simsii]